MAGVAVPPGGMPHRDFYSIAIYTGCSPFDLASANATSNPVLSGKDVTDVAAVYVADPFMIRVDDCWHMFFEILRKDVVKGVIGLATSRDGRAWEYQQVVLEEPFHLSYPCVFESDGDYFMIPESNQAGAVRLYKAVHFPTRWSWMGNLIEHVEYVDCTPFQFNGKWWLFAGCGAPPLLADTLRLFHSERLTGPWIEHPASPVISNNPHLARPGGRVVIWQNRLLRFVQDCSPHYGQKVHAVEIIELTETRYRERLATPEPILKASRQRWNSSGMHHLDPHPAEGGGCIACVDGWYWGPVD
ncbi:MAG: hypothetical protein WCO57_00255 [Verrucomicrobiota bacterium]